MDVDQRSPQASTPIVAAIATLAQTLGLAVIAEGVETTEQLTQLRELKCE
jgi:EAL domain-containing protein (putative c-di-GMP-specific phosphodiesterase class I)